MSRTILSFRAWPAVLAAATLAGCAHPQTEADSQPRLTPAAAAVSTTRAALPPATAQVSAPTMAAAAPRRTAASGPAASAPASTSTTPRPTGVPGRAAAATPSVGATASVVGAVSPAATTAAVSAAAFAVPSRGGVRLAPTARGPLTGKVVAVDPGHNGRFVGSVDNKLVPAGAGRTKPCNTSGTSDAAGRTEHAFTWSVASSLVQQLRSRGATVLLTRPDDRGVGPCVDERARIGNLGHADLVLSVHADGNMSQRARGFHVIVSTAMAGGARAELRSRGAAAQAIRALQSRTRLPRSTYIGGGTALSPRSDIAGLNLSLAPAIMLEAGNMRQTADDALLQDPAQRRGIATALADAAVATLR